MVHFTISIFSKDDKEKSSDNKKSESKSESNSTLDKRKSESESKTINDNKTVKDVNNNKTEIKNEKIKVADENNPENIENFDKYVNRDQYGDWSYTQRRAPLWDYQIKKM